MVRKTFVKVGDRFQNNAGRWCEVLEVNKWNDIIVKFDDTLTVKSFQADSLKRGIFFDPYYRTYWGFGFIGVGKYGGRSHKSSFNTWMHMIERCYDINSKPYALYGGKGVRVDEAWANFQTFAEWFEQNKVEGWHMDKDFISPDKAIYSQDTCVFLPPEVNSLFTGYHYDMKTMGVGRTKQGGWFSACTVNGKQKYLGVSGSWLEAKIKYLTERRKVVDKICSKYILPDRVIDTMYKMVDIKFYLDGKGE